MKKTTDPKILADKFKEFIIKNHPDVMDSLNKLKPRIVCVGYSFYRRTGKQKGYMCLYDLIEDNRVSDTNCVVNVDNDFKKVIW